MYSFASLVGGAYGPSPENTNAVQFVNLKDCVRDVKAHLKSCNILTDIESIDSERTLLLARAGESTGTVIFPVIERRFTCKSYKLLTLFLRHFHRTTMSATGDSLSQTQVGVPGGGWRGGHSTKFYTERLRPDVQTLTIYIPFLIVKVPLSYTFHRKLYPFHIPAQERIKLLTCGATFAKLFTLETP